MAEQVKYTEQERMEAFDFLEAQMALKTPMREWGLNLAAKLHSVRAEAQQRLTDAQGEVKRLRARFGAVDGRLAAAEKLYETWKTEDTVAMMNLLEHSSVREKGAGNE